MSKDPIIDLEPRGFFSWRIVGGFVLAWAFALVAAVTMKSGMVRMLMPLIATLFVIYVGVCTLLFLKNRK